VFPTMSVRENLEMGAFVLRGRPARAAVARAARRLGAESGKLSVSGRDEVEPAAPRSSADAALVEERTARVLDTFPDLRDRLDVRAGSLSGGQQQMLAFGMALLHDPEILLIDELSLGLAPTVVADLIGVVERLRREGLSMIVVEQSLNVALAIADRAVFLEKGRVRFTGPTAELAERGDLVRAVFLGADGGGG